MDQPIYYKGLDEGSSEYGSSYWKELNKCPLRFWHRYILRTPAPYEETEITARGTLVHKGCAAFYRRLQVIQEGGNPEEWIPPGDAIRLRAERGGPLYANQLQLSLEIVDHYIQTVGVRDRLRIIAVEAPVKAQCGVTRPGDPVYYDPRVDLVFMDGEGLLYGMDHKTSGAMVERTYRSYSRSLQFIGLAWLVRELSKPGVIPGCKGYGGIYLNMIGVNKPFKLLRRPVQVGEQEIQGFPIRRVLDAQRRDEYIALSKHIGPLAWPKLDNDDGCQGRYSPCPYWGVACDGA